MNADTILLRSLTVGACLGAMSLAASVARTASADSDDETGPATLELTGTVRDFHERTVPGGHPDFEQVPDHGYGLYSGNISPQLGADGKPVFTGVGFKVDSEWKDSDGRKICWSLFNPDLGDHAGQVGDSDTGGIESYESFHTWYRNDLGVNMSRPLTLTFQRQNDGSYVFDDEEDPIYQDIGGFFPIDDDLYGNSAGGPEHNFHFTFELNTRFTYDAGAGSFFMFTGDDDVWVFINNQLVIDLGGVHSAKHQYVDLSRLGLADGESYQINFFFAERHRTQSNFRIQTNLVLENVDPPMSTSAFD